MRHTDDQLRFSCDCAPETILHRPPPPFCARFPTPPPQPLLYSLHLLPFLLLFSFFFQQLFVITLGIIAHLTTTLLICCQFLSILYFSFFFEFLSFRIWFGLSIFNFLYFPLRIPFRIPATRYLGGLCFVQSAIKTFVAWINKEIYAYSGIFR